ncbi:MAG: hypothetical protein ACOYXN_11050 [Acidobacteriota bacterium]
MVLLNVGTEVSTGMNVGWTILAVVVLLVLLCPMAYASFYKAKRLSSTKYSHHVGALLNLVIGLAISSALLFHHKDITGILLAAILGSYFLALSIVHFRQIKGTSEEDKSKRGQVLY